MRRLHNGRADAHADYLKLIAAASKLGRCKGPRRFDSEKHSLDVLHDMMLRNALCAQGRPATQCATGRTPPPTRGTTSTRSNCGWQQHGRRRGGMAEATGGKTLRRVTMLPAEAARLRVRIEGYLPTRQPPLVHPPEGKSKAHHQIERGVCWNAVWDARSLPSGCSTSDHHQQLHAGSALHRDVNELAAATQSRANYETHLPRDVPAPVCQGIMCGLRRSSTTSRTLRSNSDPARRPLQRVRLAWRAR